MIDKSNVQVGEVSDYRLVALNNFSNNSFESSFFMGLLWLFFFQTDVLYFFAALYIFLNFFLAFFLKEVFVLWVYFAHILKFLQILLRFVKSHSIIIPEMIENPFAFEIYLRHLLTLYHLFDLIDDCLIFRTIKDLWIILFVMHRSKINYHFLFVRFDLTKANTVLKNLIEVHVVFW